MARKPAHILAKAGHHSPRQIIWQMIRNLGSFTAFSAQDIVKALDKKVNLRQVQEYLLPLTKGGFLQVANPANLFSKNIYTLINDVGIDAPRVAALEYDAKRCGYSYQPARQPTTLSGGVPGNGRHINKDNVPCNP